MIISRAYGCALCIWSSAVRARKCREYCELHIDTTAFSWIHTPNNMPCSLYWIIIHTNHTRVCARRKSVKNSEPRRQEREREKDWQGGRKWRCIWIQEQRSGWKAEVKSDDGVLLIMCASTFYRSLHVNSVDTLQNNLIIYTLLGSLRWINTLNLNSLLDLRRWGKQWPFAVLWRCTDSTAAARFHVNRRHTNQLVVLWLIVIHKQIHWVHRCVIKRGFERFRHRVEFASGFPAMHARAPGKSHGYWSSAVPGRTVFNEQDCSFTAAQIVRFGLHTRGCDGGYGGLFSTALSRKSLRWTHGALLRIPSFLRISCSTIRWKPILGPSLRTI